MLGLTEYLILSLLPKQHPPPHRAIAKILEIVRSFVLDLLKRFSCLPEIILFISDSNCTEVTFTVKQTELRSTTTGTSNTAL